MPDTPAHRPTVHMIGNAHIDHAWLWRWPEAHEEVLATCRSALDRMREYPEFVFSFSSAVSYEWIEAAAPELFAEIRERVAEGRWNVVGGWYVQPDCNIPSGESIVRQALYGKRYFQEKLGVDVQVGYNVDTFGHAGSLPQLLAKAGMPYYVFFRPDPREKPLPNGVFWWEAPDGSRVLACRPPHHYNSGAEGLEARIRQSAEERPAPLDDVLCFYGVGNHGGGPTIRNIESILALRQAADAPAVVFGTPDAFFAAALRTTREYPTVAEELQHHSRGCYSVHSEIKRANRLAEHALLNAERLAAVAAHGFGEPYPRADLTAAWKLALFNQFHDILAGTCIPEAYEDAREDYRRLHRLAGGVQERALRAIGRRVDTRGGEAALLVFNPLPWRRRGPQEVVVETRLGRPVLTSQRRRPGGVRLRDAAGAEVACQLGRVEHAGGAYRLHLCVDAELPGLGYRLLYPEILPAAEPSPLPQAPQPALEPQTTLENEHLRAVVDPHTGWLTSLYDKALGAELLAHPAATPVIVHDPSDTWSHGVASFRDDVGRFIADGRVAVVERGPLRSVVRARSRRGESVVEQDFILRRGARQLEVEVRIDWHEQWRMLKLEFPLALAHPVATYETAYGHVVREANGEEEPGQQWVDVTGEVATASGERTTAGLSLLNDGKYGFDVLDGELRMTVLRSPAYAFHEPRQVEPGVDYAYVDQGRQRFRYALAPHAGSWAEAETPRRAWELNAPVITWHEGRHRGELPEAQGFLEVAPGNVVASVVKLPEDGDGLIVRLFESAGQPTRARVELAYLGPAEGLDVALAAHEVKTLLIADGRAVEVDLLERPLG